ncbi:hypothetical protein FB45DRAFT_902422 [Roridomyces roridus]|uniref:BZIP domain-containing protein n=1 Tax=Roridomyces roridus TaxID=1738132 RepID=A0AAD7C3K5_9AGAR|nr:hypothetical protein FB45DRAFT_902422 [Roridomyces roridus]
MPPTRPSARTKTPLDPSTAKLRARLQNTAAQKRYRQRNLEVTREKARKRMRRRREAQKGSIDAEKALEARCERDAEKREEARRTQFKKCFGEDAFKRHYIPILNNKDVDLLPWARWDWVEEQETARIRELDKIIASTRSPAAREEACMEREFLCQGPHLKRFRSKAI